MNNDLISRAALLLKKAEDEYGVETVLASDIERAPAVDAEPVRHGWWIKIAEGYQKCSACDEAAAIFSGNRNYCPNCGAKMDAEEARNERS